MSFLTTKNGQHPPRNSSWNTLNVEELDRDCWQRLVRNEIPAVVIRDFATPDECARLVERSQVIGFGPYEKVVPPIDRVGATVFEHNGSAISLYFAEAERVRAIQGEIFSQSFSPLERFMSRLSGIAGAPVQIAADPIHGTYSAGLIRRIENGALLHIDYAPAEHPEWWVAQVEAQLSWNLYLELDPVNPGRTHVYNREWSAKDVTFKIPDSYGYQHAVTDGAKRFTLHPTRGDVYIFNTRNFHEVESSKGRRTTVTSAVGVLPDGRIVLWS